LSRRPTRRNFGRHHPPGAIFQTAVRRARPHPEARARLHTPRDPHRDARGDDASYLKPENRLGLANAWSARLAIIAALDNSIGRQRVRVGWSLFLEE
jgi:hypothetical protein